MALRRETTFQERRPPVFEEAQRALMAFWASPGTQQGASQAADACRKLEPKQLHLLRAWIPMSSPGSSTAVKCDVARSIVTGVLAEKGAS